jgi:hypothetical protein
MTYIERPTMYLVAPIAISTITTEEGVEEEAEVIIEDETTNITGEAVNITGEANAMMETMNVIHLIGILIATVVNSHRRRLRTRVGSLDPLLLADAAIISFVKAN